MRKLLNIFNRNSKDEKEFHHGIAFAGGGARGVAHIGALKALYESGLEYQCFSGTSAGAIIAVLCGAGWSPEQMYEFLSTQNITSFSSLMIPRKGFLKLDGLGKKLTEEIGFERIEELPHAVHLHAVDLISGKVVAFNEGPIDTLVTASCSIPGLFSPIEYEDMVLVDGGLLNNLPVESIRPRCEKVTGININPITTSDSYQNILNILNRTFTLAVHGNVQSSMKLADICFDLKGVEEFGILDNSKAQEVFDIGYNCTRSLIKELEQKQEEV